VHDFNWYGIDYASWILAEQGMLWVQAQILKGWMSIAAGDDPMRKDLFNAFQLQLGAPEFP
jgi:hypothetical protein